LFIHTIVVALTTVVASTTWGACPWHQREREKGGAHPGAPMWGREEVREVDGTRGVYIKHFPFGIAKICTLNCA